MRAAVRAHPDGAVIAVRVLPSAGRSGIVGMHGEELKVRVCSPPVDGRANDEVCAVLADALGLRAREVRVVGGHTSRSKQVAVTLGESAVLGRLAARIGPGSASER